MTVYGTLQEKGFILITNGVDALYIQAEYKDVKGMAKGSLAGLTGPKRVLVGKPLGKTQVSLGVNGFVVDKTTHGAEDDWEEVIRILALWTYTTTYFPFKLYWVYSLADDITVNHNDIGVASVASNVITLDATPLTVDQNIGDFVYVVSGTGAGDYYFIIDNTTGTITTAEASPNVDGTSVIDVLTPNYHQFPNKALSGFNNYLEGGWDGNIQFTRSYDAFYLNFNFIEFNKG